MTYITYMMAAFMLLAAFDRIIGNRFGVGKQFEDGILLLGTLTLSMVGMIIIAPLLAEWMRPVFALLPEWIDPSILTASVFANDMGGAPLSDSVARNAEIGHFNALVVASMMGCTVSFTVPFGLGGTPASCHREMLLGLLCGVVTIPVGCFVGGLVLGIAPLALLIDLLPLLLFSALIGAGILLVPELCVKIFNILGIVIKGIITVGLAVGIFRYLTGVELLPHTETLDGGVDVVVNACAVMAGTLPMLYLLSKLLDRPLRAAGRALGINEHAALGFVSSLATSVTTFSMMEKMDRHGIILNSAFLVSGAFLFTDHFAFTMAYAPECLWAVVIGKFTAAILALVVAVFVAKKNTTQDI